MAGNPNFGNLYSTSTDNYLPALKDNYTSMSRLLDWLKKSGNVKTEDGGSRKVASCNICVSCYSNKITRSIRNINRTTSF